MSKELFAREALAQIPKILTLLDRNPHSPTFGCFDRNYWHYKIIDFPSGMAQEFVWPLALAYHLKLDHNPYYAQPAVRDWIHGAILFAAHSSRSDGSCDDYFPFERAGGAAAFSLLAMLESYRLVSLEDRDAFSFFERRARWLAQHHESGRLSNHQALIALCLELVSRRLDRPEFRKHRDERVARVLSWQSAEGWFQEYDGCDPGYHTLTLNCLAWLYELQPTLELREPIARAVSVAAEFIHPDGTYGGEYGSRNTYNFFPHGFELAGQWMPEALSVNDRFLCALARGLAPCYSDDHILGHHAWNYLLAWRDFVATRPAQSARKRGRVFLRDAGLLIDRRDGIELYLGLRKGGVFKFFRNDAFVASDTQLSIQCRTGGASRNAVAHLIDNYQTEIKEDEVRISGSFGWANHVQMTTLRLLMLRLIMMTFGRFWPNTIRKLLQRRLITGKQPAPFRFSRSIRWQADSLHVKDEISAQSWDKVAAAGIGGDQTSIYVAMSRTFHINHLQPWFDLTDSVRGLRPGEPLTIERKL